MRRKVSQKPRRARRAAKPMRWLVAGVHQYDVRRAYRLTVDGDPANGVTHFAERVIWLDANLRGDVLEEVARHEYGEALEYHTAIPRTREERRQFESTVAMAFNRQLVACGGVAAIEALPVEVSVTPAGIGAVAGRE